MLKILANTNIITNPILDLNNTTLSGFIGKQKMKAILLSDGISISLMFNPPYMPIKKSCLLLASIHEAARDHLYIHNDKLWISRYYPRNLKLHEIELLLNQQRIVYSILSINNNINEGNLK